MVGHGLHVAHVYMRRASIYKEFQVPILIAMVMQFLFLTKLILGSVDTQKYSWKYPRNPVKGARKWRRRGEVKRTRRQKGKEGRRGIKGRERRATAWFPQF